MKTESSVIRLSNKKQPITSVEQVCRILMNEIEKNYKIIEELRFQKLM